MKKTVIIFTCALIFGLIFSCGQPEGKVFYINSYHQGYSSSDSIMAGIREGFSDRNIMMESYFMDSKRQSDSIFIRKQTAEVLRRIEKFKPDVIIASDDNAVKYVIAPYFKDGPIPVVFCGVNWSCAQYGLPSDYVTGMLEVLPLKESIALLKQYYPKTLNLTVLSENSTSERSNKKLLQPLYKEMGLTVNYALVETYSQWKEEFIKANAQADMIFIPTNGAVKSWDREGAAAFVKENIRVPVFSCDDFMTPYAVLGLTKVAKEQGQWASAAALKIMHGIKPGEIPVTENMQSKIYYNPELAEKINFKPDQDFLKRSMVIVK